MKTKFLIVALLLVLLPSVAEATSPLQACTKQYDPVCGAKQVQCVTGPCYPIYQTYGNSCELGNDIAEYIHAGECTAEETGPVKPVESYVPPKGCTGWFDGCNHCSLGQGGAMCTLMACQGTPQAGYCTAYEKPTPTPPPVITTTPTPTPEEPVATTATATEPAPSEGPGFFASIWISISSWFTSLFFWL